MQLEDHLGDIVRKAAKMAGVSNADAAKAAGLSGSEYADLVESGRVPSPINTGALAGVLKLDAQKLEGIVKGWLPPVQDLSRWKHLRVITTIQRWNSVNAFMVWDAKSREAALFDTGWEADPVQQVIAAERLELKYILITHTHDDHVAAQKPLCKAFPGAKLLSGAQAVGALPLNLGGLKITGLETPGHARDGMIYVVEGWPGGAPKAAFIGDTIFAGSMALGFVSWQTLKKRVLENIFSLPAETLLCPGHGPLTTLAEEKAHNPFF